LTRIALRSVALLLVAVLVVPAIGECAGWIAAAAGRHACCGARGGVAPETSMTDCCTMSDPSSEAGPPELQAARPSLKLLGPLFTPVLTPAVVRVPIPWQSNATPRTPVVPRYLQQASLLI
jgi:hypothetical protein